MTDQLEKAFRRIGLSEAGAKDAARGRDHGPLITQSAKTPKVHEPGSLVEAFKRLHLSDSQARVAARGRSDLREVVKNIAGLPASCFAWTPDPEDPTTWKLQIARSAAWEYQVRADM